MNYINCGQIISPDQDVYVLITVLNTTTIDELKELINFYLKIQANCQTCVPQINNSPCKMWFGQFFEDFTTSLNTTSAIEEFINSQIFKTNSYENAKTSPTDNDYLDIKWQLDLVKVDIGKIQLDPKGKIIKKKIAILSNYYFPHISDKLFDTRVNNMNVTYVSLFTLNGTFLPDNVIEDSLIPMNVFDKSKTNFNYSKAKEDFLNLFIDFNYEELFSPVRMFFELKRQNIDIGVNYSKNIFDNDACRLINDTEYYEVSILYYFTGYQIEIILYIPNLEAYTFTYFKYISSLLIDFNISHESILDKCTEKFYSRLGYWLIQGPDDVEQFNIYLTDDYPNCMINTLKNLGVDGSSFNNHLDFIIHDSINNTIDKNIIFDKVTSYLLPYDNATDRASHVFLGDLTNSTIINELSICVYQSDYINLIPIEYNKPTEMKHYQWLIISLIILAYLITSITIIYCLMKYTQTKHRKNFIIRRTTVTSTEVTGNRFRFASKIVAATTVATEIIHEPGPIQYRNWKIPSDELLINFVDVIGRGSSATIYKGYLNGISPLAEIFPNIFTQNFQKCNVAIKISLNYNLYDIEQVNNEITSMIQLKYHPNICSFLGWSIIRDSPCMIFELIHSDLLIWSRGFRESDYEIPPIRDVYAILWQICNGMAHISSCKLVHRDLAARNVLLTEDLRVKITDFGLCCNFDDSTYTYTGSVTKKLPIKWLSPEAILDRSFSEKSDVWSFGILIYEILTFGIVPYATMSNEEMVDYIRSDKRLQLPSSTPEDLKKITLECWNMDPADRPLFSQLKIKFRKLLEQEACDYGYLAHSELNGQKTPGIDSIISNYGFIFEDEFIQNNQSDNQSNDIKDKNDGLDLNSGNDEMSSNHENDKTDDTKRLEFNEKQRVVYFDWDNDEVQV